MASAVLLLATIATPAPAEATVSGTSTQPSASSGFHFDLEVDPTAYLLSGYSVHVGAGWQRVRLDLGVFATDVPKFLHGNDGFNSSFDGFGAKLQYFPFAEQAGAFVGIGAGLNRQHVELDGTGFSSKHSDWSAGVDVGWRFTLWKSFYLTPWVGFDHTFDAKDVILDGHVFKNSSWSVFPAVHLGYRLR